MKMFMDGLELIKVPVRRTIDKTNSADNIKITVKQVEGKEEGMVTIELTEDNKVYELFIIILAQSLLTTLTEQNITTKAVSEIFINKNKILRKLLGEVANVLVNNNYKLYDASTNNGNGSIVAVNKDSSVVYFFDITDEIET